MYVTRLRNLRRHDRLCGVANHAGSTLIFSPDRVLLSLEEIMTRTRTAGLFRLTMARGLSCITGILVEHPECNCHGKDDDDILQ